MSYTGCLATTKSFSIIIFWYVMIKSIKKANLREGNVLFTVHIKSIK